MAGTTDITADGQRHRYRQGVGIMVINRDGLVLVAERIGQPGAWQMPQGGIDAGEEPEAAALRELEEEIGTANVSIIGRTPEPLTYDFPPEMLAGRGITRRYRGQAQHWFAARFLGQDSDINLAVHTPREFERWRWCGIEEVPGLIIAFKRPVYEAVVELFRPLAVPG